MIRAPYKVNLPPEPTLRFDRIDGGICLKYMEMQIGDNQSPFMQNLNADDRGSLTKRPGQTVVHTFSEGPIHATCEYKGMLVVAHGTKLSKYAGMTETTLISGLANSKGSFFIMNDTVHYLNGTNFIQYDGSTAKEVAGYVPTLAIAVPPSGGGTILEDLNLIQPAFKVQFSPDGTAKDFQLPLGGLDAATVLATLSGTAKTEGTDFTVNRTLGKLTFTTAPTQGINTLVVTAYKTTSGITKIKGCKYGQIYGGNNDTRVFIAGNENYKNFYFYCGLYDPTYWPENNFNKLGSDYETITGFAVQYDTLITFKERSLYYTYYQLEENGASFPTRPLNSQIGCDMPWTIQIIDNNPVWCDMPWTIQIIDNNPVWCTTYAGPQILTASTVRDERNVKPLGANINGALNRLGLLDEEKTDLLNATSYDHEGKYYLCVNDKVWVWDYRLTPYMGDDELLSWFPYTNINANCWLAVDRVLYTGDRVTGNLTKFTPGIYNDYNQPINGIWRSKLFDFQWSNWLKTILEIYFTTRANQYSSINLKYYSDNGEAVDNMPILSSATSSFSLKKFSLLNFTLQTSRIALSIKRKPKIKKVKYFQIEFSNNNLNENLSIMDLTVKYLLDREVR